jgi:hypothetical protein
VLCYTIGGNRFCGNIGRAHKSNATYIVANLDAGVWFQKCYDPDCRHYRSPSSPIPGFVLEDLSGTDVGHLDPEMEAVIARYEVPVVVPLLPGLLETWSPELDALMAQFDTPDPPSPTY